MKNVLKWIGIVLGGLIIVIGIAAVGMILSTNSRFNRTYEVDVEPLTVSVAEADPSIGEHFAEIHCRACHGEDLGGGPFFEDDAIGFADAPNLTSGEGGVGASYTETDWIRALRHGVKLNGTSVFVMPANDFYYLSDADLAGIIAYMQSIPPVDREVRHPTLTPFGKILYAVGAFGDLLYAEVIDHENRPVAPAVGMTVEYGEYLVNVHGCKSCHGENLAGDQPAEPGAPMAPNLTPGGELLAWSEADFMTTIRTGVTPSGHELSTSMPWEGLRHLTDEELQTIWLYLQSLDPLETNQQ